MRILIYVLGFIAFSIFGFFMVGVVMPTTDYENTIVINRSLDKTWKVFSNDTLIYDWMQGLKKIENIKGTKMQAGSEFKMYLTESGQDYIITEKVREVKENSLYAFSIENEVLKNNVDMQFKEIAPYTTEIKSFNQVHAKNWFLRSMFFFLKSDFKEQEMKTLNNLKNLIESDPLDYQQ